jgi:hypothetical protein
VVKLIYSLVNTSISWTFQLQKQFSAVWNEVLVCRLRTAIVQWNTVKSLLMKTFSLCPLSHSLLLMRQLQCAKVQLTFPCCQDFLFFTLLNTISTSNSKKTVMHWTVFKERCTEENHFLLLSSNMHKNKMEWTAVSHSTFCLWFTLCHIHTSHVYRNYKVS